MVVMVFAIALLIMVVGSLGGGGLSGGQQITRSTVQREPIPRGQAVDVGYYTDELNWIGNASQLTAGLRNFYDRTGVKPYLYIVGTIDGTRNPSNAQMQAFAEAKYDELFRDEAHMLLVFQDDGTRYRAWVIRGQLTMTVMDQEALDILQSYLSRYYTSDLSDEAYFSRSFDEASKRIMSVTRSPWITVWIVMGIAALLFIGFAWWSKAKHQKNLEAEQTERILNTPLETFGDKEDNK